MATPELPDDLPSVASQSSQKDVEVTHSQRLASPAVARNRDVILDVLRDVLAERRQVLELASGSGEHAVHFAHGLPHLEWQPSDASPRALESIADWRAEAALPNLKAPITLDVQAEWPEIACDALVAINLIHISPWRVTSELMLQAGRRLPKDGVLYLYGPYKRGGQHTAPSNEGFDVQLKSRNPLWGVRDLEAVIEEAKRNGLRLDKVIKMPANNLSVVFRHQG
ncbi:SAM-dependent methyltransferase [Halomonas sp. SF2003]|nr:SAM-dependent methyltransferase [Halomonas sp. SF2003]